MFRILNIIAVSGIALLMAACETAPVVVEDLPAPETTTANELLILPLAGLSSTVGGALGEKMAWGMREAGYPARSASLSNEANPMLTGWIEEASDSGDIIWLNINWAFYGAGGTLIGNYRQETAVSRDGWSRLSPDTLAVIVAQAVPAIHEIAKVEVFPDGLPSVTAAFVELPVIELIPPKQETIVVSGDGLSRIDASGNETMDQPLSVATEPTFAPDYDQVAAQEGLPQGIAAATPPTVNDGMDDVMNEDNVGRLTPESAALVTTLPELTISETIVPVQDSQDSVVDESLMKPEPEPVDVALAPGVSQQNTVQASQIPQVPEAPVTPVSSDNPQPGLAEENAVSGIVSPVFLVRTVSGAPGDGNLALRTAILQSLRGADAMVTDNPGQASHVIQGSVQVDAPFAGRQHTRIIWLVTTIDGDEVGTAIQKNDVPQGSLDGKWGEVAQVITNAAIPGVARLFDARLDAGSAQGNLAQPDLPHVFGEPQP